LRRVRLVGRWRRRGPSRRGGNAESCYRQGEPVPRSARREVLMRSSASLCTATRCQTDDLHRRVSRRSTIAQVALDNRRVQFRQVDSAAVIPSIQLRTEAGVLPSRRPASSAIAAAGRRSQQHTVSTVTHPRLQQFGAVPPVRRRNLHHHQHYQRHSEHHRPHPQARERRRPFPDRAGSAQVPALMSLDPIGKGHRRWSNLVKSGPSEEGNPRPRRSRR